MKLSKKALIVAMIATAGVAQAEMKSIDDTTMSDVTAQSGIVIEAGFGTIGRDDQAADGDYFDHDWSTAGIKIDAFKWEVDVETYEADNNSAVGVPLDPGFEQAVFGGTITAGFIARDIAIAGHLDITIDAVGDVSALQAAAAAGGYDGTEGGIGITFAGSKIDFRIGDMGVYVNQINFASGVSLEARQLSSFGGIEILGLDINGLELVVRGNGLAR